MNNRRCSTFLAVAAALASGLSLHGAAAQDWPTRPVTMVVPFAAGSASDTMARILSARLSEVLGQQVVIENVSGAGGMTGVARVAKAAPDGYQFVLGGVDTFAQIQTLYKRPLYNSATDFAPVVLVVEQALLLVARNELPANNLQGFIAYAKANQGKMQYGSAGVGSDPIWPARSSTPRWVSTSPTSPIAVRRPRCRISLPVGSIISARSQRPARRRSKARR